MPEKTITTIPILDAFERAEGCPFCLMWTETERSCLDRVESNEVTVDSEFRKKVVRAAGFCNRHMHLLFEASFSGHTENGLGYALYMKDIIAEAERKMADAKPDRHAYGGGRRSGGFLGGRGASEWRPRAMGSAAVSLVHGDAGCPVCEMLLDFDRRTLKTFLKMLKDKAFATSYSKSGEICLPHFASSLGLLATEKDKSDPVSLLLFQVQIDRMSRSSRALDGRIRKYAWEHRDEALTQEEAGSQRAALRMIAGAEGLYCQKRKAVLSD